MLTFRVLSELIKYPAPELRAETREAERILREEGLLSKENLNGVCGFLQHLRETAQLELEAAHLDAFDRGRSTSLYLFEHIHGESRDRGQAMVKLLMRYRVHGLDLQQNELPDYLPLFLEFLSTRSVPEARKHLTEVVDIITLIGARLYRRGDIHAPLLAAIASLAIHNSDRAELASSIQTKDRDDTPAELDKAWEDARVTFNDAVEMSGESFIHDFGSPGSGSARVGNN
jgi:nitrate reductase molybdenum cofactor assembly chaperone NarJ/NarW